MTRNNSRNHLLYSVCLLTISIALFPATVVAQTAALTPVDRSSTQKATPAELNDGNPLFVPPTTYKVDGYPTSVAVTDVNGDGKRDVLLANLDGRADVLLGNGDGTFQSVVTYPVAGYSPQSIAVADLNGDGRLDLGVATGVAPRGWSSNISVFIGKGDGTFQPAIGYDCGDALSIAIADVNGDGIKDLLVAIANGNGLAGVLLGNGDGTFQPCTTYGSGGTYPASLAVADLNGDGKPDLVLGNWFGWAGQKATVGVLLGNGDGTFQRYVTYYSAGNQLGGVAAADLNRDGKLDVVAVNCVHAGSLGCSYKYGMHGVVGVMLGNGDGTLQPVVPYDSGGYSASRGAIADVDGDGKLDLVITNNGFAGEGEGSIGVLLGNGDGTFQEVIPYATAGLQPWDVAIADVNDDGRPDLVIAAGGLVAVMLNNTGPHTLTTATLTSTANPVNASTSLTYRATVAAGSGSILTGTVTFQDGATAIATVPLSGNQASYTTSYTPRHNGFHSVTASYSGDFHNSVSTSAPLLEDVLAPSKTIVTTSGSPSTLNQPVTFAATVSSSYGPISNGESVIFYDGATAIGTSSTAGGLAMFTTSSLSLKTHIIRAAYTGDAMFAASSGMVVQVVNRYTTTTSIISNLNPAIFGQTVVFTAAVTTSGPVPPTGTVLFTSAGYSLGSATLNSSGVATLRTSNFNAGRYPVTAVYKGDSHNLGSGSSVLNQSVLQTTSAATISSSLNPSSQGRAVTFTARVSSPTVTPTGPVTFKAGTTVLGTVQLRGGKASYTTASLPPGSTVVQVAYVGNSNIGGSSAAMNQVITP